LMAFFWNLWRDRIVLIVQSTAISMRSGVA